MVINGDESEIKSKELIAFKRLNEQLEEKNRELQEQLKLEEDTVMEL